MDRPRRVHHDIDYKVTRELEKEKEKDNNLDPFGFNDNNYLNEVGDFEEEPKKISGGTASWLEDTDKLNLPSRFYNTNAKSSSGLNYKEKNLIHGRDNLFDRTNSCNLRDKEKEKDIKEELEIEKMKSNRLQSELDKLRTKKEIMNSKNILQYIHKISYDSLGLGKKIGQGGFSEIYESQWMGIPIAVKVIFDPNINEALLEEFNNEVEKLFILRHPYIIQLYGITDREKKQKLAVITELAPRGSLFDYLHKNPKTKNNLSLEFKNKITKQLIHCMNYIHSRGYVHRDLKTQNILLDKNMDMKLCDFGLTKLKTELNSGSGQFAGTPCYMAPELFDRKFYDEKIDVFAFGTVVWEIYTQKIPYFNCEALEIKQKVTKGEELICSSIVPKQIASLIEKCRRVKPSERPSFKEMENMDLF
jgi:tRNA A-37 threonylcarbamoyl transferase component Bud32